MAFAPIVLSLVLFVVVTYARRKREPINKLPIPPASEATFFWGHEYAIWAAEASKKYFEWTKALGPVYRIKAPLFQRDVIVAGDNASSTHVLHSVHKYGKAPAFLPITTKLLGRGLVWADGDEHKRQRRVIAPAFSVSAIAGMETDVFECTEKLVGRLRNIVISNGYEATVNIEPQVAITTLDIVGRVAFGYDFGSGESSEAKAISDAWHKDVLMGRTFAGFCAPVVIGAFPAINHLPIPMLQEDGVTKVIALKLANRMLAEHRSNALGDDGKDILSVLIRDSKKRKLEGGAAAQDILEDWQLLENISTFIMVGHETTSCSVIFTLLELARNPETQTKLREELATINEFNYETLSKLPYLDAVTKEGLRLHPASPRTDRIALTDDVIPLSKPITTSSGEIVTQIPIKAGQVIQIPTGVLNANPDIWGPDALKFMPERFLEKGLLPADEDMPRGPYSGLATFLDGPRVCIGWRLAVMEFKILIALMVKEIVFETTDSKIEELIAGTLQAFCDGKGANLPLKMKLAHA